MIISLNNWPLLCTNMYNSMLFKSPSPSRSLSPLFSLSLHLSPLPLSSLLSPLSSLSSLLSPLSSLLSPLSSLLSPLSSLLSSLSLSLSLYIPPLSLLLSLLLSSSLSAMFVLVHIVWIWLLWLQVRFIISWCGQVITHTHRHIGLHLAP